MKQVINYLFNKGYLPWRKSSFLSDKRKHKIFNDPKHDEFREALLHEICKEMAESYEALAQPVKNMEMKGELNAITRLYGRFIQIMAPEKELKESRYIDPLKKIEEEIRKNRAN